METKKKDEKIKRLKKKIKNYEKEVNELKEERDQLLIISSKLRSNLNKFTDTASGVKPDKERE